LKEITNETAINKNCHFAGVGGRFVRVGIPVSKKCRGQPNIFDRVKRVTRHFKSEKDKSYHFSGKLQHSEKQQAIFKRLPKWDKVRKEE